MWIFRDLPVATTLQEAFPFTFVSYLGIYLELSLYFQHYPSLYKKSEEDLQGWVTHDFSFGKIYSIKMMLLPYLVYYFHSLPIANVHSDLSKFQSKIIHYVWGRISHRLSKQVLFTHKTTWGLGLPHLTQYYQAAQVVQLSAAYACLEKPEWIAMERRAVNMFPSDSIKWQLARWRVPILALTLANSCWNQVRNNQKLPFILLSIILPL